MTNAEILWTLKVAASGFSFASCDNLSQEFKVMFPDSKIADSFKLGHAKVAYEISHGLGPYFHDEILRDIKDNKSFFTLSFDEATNHAGNKQMDIHVRYWSENKELPFLVQNFFLRTFIVGHAAADIMKEKILCCIKDSKLDLGHWLMLGSDGPNVNKKLISDIDSYLRQTGYKALVNVGTCNLHIMHNSFGHGLQKASEWKIEEFFDGVFKFFHKYPARKEDFRNVQKLLEVKEVVFLRYVSNRWLSLVPVIERIIDQWDSLKEYFLKTLPSKQGHYRTKSFHFSIINDTLKDPMSLPRLHFLKSVGDVYEKFQKIMQSEGPLIHIIYDELQTLCLCLLRSAIKPALLDDISRN